MQNLSEIAMMLGALELGIIPPQHSVDQALAQMSRRDRRITTRKFRKLIRKHRRGVANCASLTQAEKRRIAGVECRKMGNKILRDKV